VGSVALALNIVSASIFHEHSHANSDAEDGVISLGRRLGERHSLHHHAAPERRVQKQMNFAVAGILVHILGDALNTIGVITVGIITLLVQGKGKQYADPALSMLISLSIIASVVSLSEYIALPIITICTKSDHFYLTAAWKSAAILLQAAPADTPLNKIMDDLLRLQYVEQVHELHVWQIDQQRTFVSAHIIVSAATGDVDTVEQRKTDERTLGEVRTCLHAWGIHSVTLQIEHCTTNLGDTCNIESGKTTALESIVSKKNRHVARAHKGLSCMVQKPLACDCTINGNIICCSAIL
jgi:zinc transporter 1